jgi:hypothetical protein
MAPLSCGQDMNGNPPKKNQIFGNMASHSTKRPRYSMIRFREPCPIQNIQIAKSDLSRSAPRSRAAFLSFVTAIEATGYELLVLATLKVTSAATITSGLN